MIKILMFVLLLSSTPSYAQIYGLEELNDKADKYVATADIQEAMRRFVKEDFIDCTKQKNLKGDEYSNYFSAIPIEINKHNQQSFLVFPSKYCYAFFGAHAIAYWIITKNDQNQYKLLYEGRSDAVELLSTFTKGMKDLRSIYNYSFIVLKFNGRKYKKVADGEFQRDN
jgi:hypothetical protein